ncbi:hypothetical protein BO86DRAFT_393670 [Aspergillus japonicus CBS 114.51]|uniref:Uncharacterized protein n=1 Tax=Aspergillus japonicus CBS 114.51 TaxID=1448312 RepID=A0A8T8WK82_ASPJA|nr:hypothetical protein BO86DRAFT_393670 [Aspergillus japonicus CBS 114.51]RAH76157.1 hypothetical protein BO86DRAFT_393670 [Aspergillus japonicus CBS 114.51]
MPHTGQPAFYSPSSSHLNFPVSDHFIKIRFSPLFVLRVCFEFLCAFPKVPRSESMNPTLNKKGRAYSIYFHTTIT